MDLARSGRQETQLIMSTIDRGDRVITYIFATLILLSVIPLGGNRPWIWSLLALGILILFSIQFIRDIITPKKAIKIFQKAIFPAAFFLLAMIWAGLQTVEISSSAASADNNYITNSLSIDPNQSLLFLPRLICYGMIFWISARVGKNTDIGWFLIKSFAIFSTIIAMYGLLSHISGIEKVLWINKEWGVGNVTATFINQNSYAIYCSIGLICNIVLIMKNSSNINNITGKLNKKNIKNISRLFSGENVVFITGLIVGFSALLFTNSRAGIASGLLGIMAIFIVSNVRRVKLLIYMLIIVFLVLFFGESLLIRILNTGGTDHLRLEIYRQTLILISDHIFTGQGLGTYEHAFMPYRSGELSWLTWDKAHNSYLEILVDFGVIGASFLFISLGLILKQCWIGCFRRKHQRSFSALALCVSVTITLHSLFDFSLQMPATAAVFAMILGVGWVHAFPRHRSKT